MFPGSLLQNMESQEMPPTQMSKGRLRSAKPAPTLASGVTVCGVLGTWHNLQRGMYLTPFKPVSPRPIRTTQLFFFLEEALPVLPFAH